MPKVPATVPAFTIGTQSDSRQQRNCWYGSRGCGQLTLSGSYNTNNYQLCRRYRQRSQPLQSELDRTRGNNVIAGMDQEGVDNSLFPVPTIPTIPNYAEGTGNGPSLYNRN